MAEVKIIRPQEGYQERVLSCPADIVIGGAAAGVGKTFSLLLDPMRDFKVPKFGGVIFRRTSPQIRNQGGLWDTSMGLYPGAGGLPRESLLEWEFARDVKMKFSHLEYEKNIFDWQGAEIPYIGFDELPHFTRKMFFYLLSRNRSTCGVKPYVRATCNPDPESWVAEFIAWWIDQNTGYPIPERNGQIRYLLVDGDNYLWGDTKEEVIEKGWYMIEEAVVSSGIDPREFVKSVAFISGSIYDNKELLKVNPAYLSNLISQDAETKASLLYGNWKVVISDKDVYDYAAFRGIFNNDINPPPGEKYITTDIALKGSDKFVVWVWEGKLAIDLLVMDKSLGNQVIDGIKTMAKKHRVANRNIIFDNDGVGQFVDGYIEDAVEFNNGSKALNDEAYFNLKTQCYYKSGDATKRNEYKMTEEVASRMYDDKMTVKQRMMHERKAIKRDKVDKDGKLRIISKDEMKAKLNGDSPDLLDAWMMREYPELNPPFKPQEDIAHYFH